MKKACRRIMVFVLIWGLILPGYIINPEPAYARNFIGNFFRAGGNVLKHVGRAIGWTAEKTVQVTKGTVRGAVKVVRKVENSRKRVGKYLRKKLPKPLGGLVSATLDKGFQALNPTTAVISKAGKIVDRVDSLRRGRQKARAMAKDLRKYGDDMTTVSRKVVTRLRQQGIVSPKQQIKVLEKTNRIKQALNKAADKIEKTSRRATLGNILSTAVGASGKLAGKIADKTAKPMVRTILAGAKRNFDPLPIAKQRLGSLVKQHGLNKVWDKLSPDKREKAQKIYQTATGKFKLTITKEGLNELIKKGKVTRIIKDSIKKGKPFNFHKPDDLDDVVKGILVDSAKSAFKKGLRDAPEKVVRDVMMNELIKLSPENEDKIREAFKNLPPFKEIRDKINQGKKDGKSIKDIFKDITKGKDETGPEGEGGYDEVYTGDEETGGKDGEGETPGDEGEGGYEEDGTGKTGDETEAEDDDGLDDDTSKIIDDLLNDDPGDSFVDKNNGEFVGGNTPSFGSPGPPPGIVSNSTPDTEKEDGEEDEEEGPPDIVGKSKTDKDKEKENNKKDEEEETEKKPPPETETRPEEKEPPAPKGTFDEDKFKIIAVIAPLAEIEYKQYILQKLTSIGGTHVTVRYGDGSERIYSGNKAVAMLLVGGYLYKMEGIGYIATSRLKNFVTYKDEPEKKKEQESDMSEVWAALRGIGDWTEDIDMSGLKSGGQPMPGAKRDPAWDSVSDGGPARYQRYNRK